MFPALSLAYQSSVIPTGAPFWVTVSRTTRARTLPIHRSSSSIAAVCSRPRGAFFLPFLVRWPLSQTFVYVKPESSIASESEGRIRFPTTRTARSSQTMSHSGSNLASPSGRTASLV